MPSWHPLTNRIFLQAIEIEGTESRNQFLLAACNGDEVLRNDVDEMLGRHFSRDSLLQSNVSALAQTVIGGDQTREEFSAETPRPGRQIGPYELKETLGQGGMGTVFLAEQHAPVKREVALKLIRAGMDSSQVVARFETERQSLAMMDHPNIARVLDAGSWEGLPYFVMELVRGEPLTQYCERRRLDIRQRLELFIHVGQAIQHAHQKGIIHRDLKPSNILVTEYDGRPTVKVIDFGLAKALADKTAGESLTMMGGVLGTPEYMSPEQASGKLSSVDTRSDVYSLGVVLYELLSGTTPLTRQRVKSASFQEILKIIQEGDIPSPSSRLLQSTESLPVVSAARQIEVPSRLPGILKGDLDWIVMKALEKEPARRYQTVGLLCQDVDNFLNHKPVSASPISKRYRIQKFVRRYRVLVTATTGVLLAMLLGLIGTVWGLFRAYDAEQKAVDLQQVETLQRKQAETALAGERDALRERSLVLSDMYADRGWAAANEGDPSLAALWFAESAQLAEGDAARVKVNLQRSRNLLANAVMPIASMKTGTLAQQLSFNSSGDLIALRSDDGFRIWDWARQQELPWTKRLSSPGNVPNHIWHPDGARILTAQSDGTVHLRQATTGESEQHISFPVVPGVTAVNTSGNQVAVAVERNIRIWNLPGAKLETTTLAHDATILWVAWSGDEQWLATIDQTNTLRIFQPLKDASPVVARLNQTAGMRPVWNRDGATLYTVESANGGSRLIELTVHVDKPFEVREVALKLDRQKSLAIQSDGQSLIVPGYMGVEYIRLRDPAPIPDLFPFPNEVWHTSFVGGTAAWLASGRSGAAKLQTLTSSGEKLSVALPHSGVIEQSCTSADGRFLATVQGDGLMRIWRPEWSSTKLDSTDASARGIRSSPSGRFVVPGEWSERSFSMTQPSADTVSLWDAESRIWIDPPGAIEGTIIDSQMLPDDHNWAVIRSNQYGCWLTVADIVSGSLSFPMRKLPAVAVSIDVCPRTSTIAVLYDTGRLEAIHSGNGHTLWSTQLSSWKWQMPQSMSSRVLYSPDGKSLIVVGGNLSDAVYVFEPTTGSQRYERIIPAIVGGHCRSVEFSHDSKLLATVSNGPKNAVRVWDLKTGTEVGKPCLHPGDFIGLFNVDFSADGQRIMTSHSDGFCRQFDWQTGIQVGKTLSHNDEVFDAVYLEDDRYVLTACRDGFCYLWDVASGFLVSSPIMVGSRQQTTFPTAIRLITNGRECAVASADSKLHILDLHRLIEPITENVSDQLARCEVLSGRSILNGTVNGLRSDEWLTAWQHVSEQKLDLSTISPVEQVESMLRLADSARTLENSEQERRILEELFLRSTELPLDDQRSFELHALVVRFFGRYHRNVVSKELLDRERDRLIKVWTSDFRNGEKSEILGGMAADAWLSGLSLKWKPVLIGKTEAQSGAEMQVSSEGELRVLNSPTARDRFELTFDVPAGMIDSLLIEPVPDSSLPHGGSGHHATGNFVLSEIDLQRVESDGSSSPIEVNVTIVDYAGSDFKTHYLRDRNVSTGWSTDKKTAEPHWLLVTFPEHGQQNAGSQLKLILSFESDYPNAVLGRFHISAGRNPFAPFIELTRNPARPTNVTPSTLMMLQILESKGPEEALQYFDGEKLAATTKSELPFLLAAIAAKKLGHHERATELLNRGMDDLFRLGTNWASEVFAKTALPVVLGISEEQSHRRIIAAGAHSDLKRYTRNIEQNPDEAALWQRRAWWYALHQEWPACGRDLLKAHALKPQDSMNWIYLGPDLIKGNLLVEYDEWRRNLSTLITSDRTPERLERYLKAMCLRPLPEGHPPLPVREMLDMIESGQGASYMPMYGFTVAGLVAFREHDYSKAIEWSRKGREFARSSVTDIEGQTLVVEALSLYSMQKWSEGDAVMEQLAKLIPEFPAADVTKAPWEREELETSFAAHDRLVLEILRREARQLSELRTSVTPDGAQPGTTSNDR